MIVNTSENKYYVGFYLDRSRPRAVTRCKIFLLMPGSGPTLVSQGRTLQGEKDVFNSVTGCRFALKRALADYGFQKSTRMLFWKEFRRCHRLRPDIVICREAFEDEARRVCAHRIVAKGSGLDWCTKHRVDCSIKTRCGLYSHQERKMLALSVPTGHGSTSFYKHLRHEYHDDPHSGFFHKLYGLGWKKMIDSGETIWPRSQAMKHEQFRRMYTGDYSNLEHHILRQMMWLPAGMSVHNQERAVKKMMAISNPTGHGPASVVNTVSHAECLEQLLANKNKVKDILTDTRWKKLRGIWKIADEKLTARMLSMSLIAAEEFKRVDAELLRRPGITKVHDEYIIDPNEFMSEFKVGEVVTCGNKTTKIRVNGVALTLRPFLNTAKITGISGPTLTIQPLLSHAGLTVKFGPVKTVMDWEVRKKTRCWLRRVWKWLSTFETGNRGVGNEAGCKC